MGWGSSARRGGGRKVRALLRKVCFGFRGREPGMSRDICRDVPDPRGCSSCTKKFVLSFRSLRLRKVCALTFSEAPPQCSVRIVEVHPHTKFAHSQHNLGCPRTSFAHIFGACRECPARKNVLRHFLGCTACSQNLSLYRQKCLAV